MMTSLPQDCTVSGPEPRKITLLPAASAEPSLTNIGPPVPYTVLLPPSKISVQPPEATCGLGPGAIRLLPPPASTVPEPPFRKYVRPPWPDSTDWLNPPAGPVMVAGPSVKALMTTL